jgi:dihydroorotase
MTLYLNEHTNIADIEYGYKSEIFTAMKLYPQGVTTNSKDGVTDFISMSAIFEKMSEIGIPLSIHSEVSDIEIDIFDREIIFIEFTTSILDIKYLVGLLIQSIANSLCLIPFSAFVSVGTFLEYFLYCSNAFS